MANSVNPQESDAQRTSVSSSGSKFFGSMFRFFSSLLRLTDEEKSDAGIYLGHQQEDTNNFIDYKENQQ